MEFYLLLFLFCIVMLIINNHTKDEKAKIVIEIITLIVLCFISGTRYYLGGTDYYIYERIFNSTPALSYFDFSSVQSIDGTYGAEIGYLFICSIIKSLGFNFFGFTLIHSIIFYSCMYIGFKKYIKNFNFLIIVFLYKFFFYNTFISLRQSITLAIFFVALKYIQDKKPFKYFIASAIAFSIHNGALIMFPLYFINKFKITKKRAIILNCIFVPTIVISMLNIPILNQFQWITSFFSGGVALDKATSLVNSTTDGGISLFHTLEYFLIMFLLITNYEKITEKNKNAEFIFKLFIILLPLFTLFRGYSILTREKDYFTLTYAIILYYLCNLKTIKNYIIIQFCTICICLFGYVRFIVSFDGGSMMPYESYVTKYISITEER